MGSYSAGHITTAEAAELVGELDRRLGRPGRRFHAGVSYRHLLVVDGGPADLKLVPPHDISGRPIGGKLPAGEGRVLRDLMEAAAPILAEHPVNAARGAAGKPTANAIWLWGQGRKPGMPAFANEHGLSGAVVTAVDLVKGIGRVAGLEVLDVPGATGWIDTNYEGKVAATLDALERVDFVFLHIEAPDEAGHEGRDDLKVQAIADFDRRVVGPVLEGLRRFPSWAAMATADHLTPVASKTHAAEPVPFAILRSSDTGCASALSFDENALAGRDLLPDGVSLMRRFLEG
jgi:2,3-bisphosphoglycerate-independent phosphoglycerate mutase